MSKGREVGGGRCSNPSKLTPIERRLIDAAATIREEPGSEVGYQHSVFCQTSLPYRDPGAGVRVWERQQGAVSLLLEAGKARHPQTKKWIDLALPSGPKPRLILFHLNSEALRRQTPEIDVGDSMTAFMRRINVDTNGRNFGVFKEQLARLAASSIRIAYDHEPTDDGVRVSQRQGSIVSGFNLWFPRNPDQRVLWPSTVVLSAEYFESLVVHAVPLDERAVAALAHSPMALDVYTWLAQRLHRIDPNRPQRISWKALQGQFGEEYARLRKFRENFVSTLRLVQSQYPDAEIEVEAEGMALKNSRPPVGQRLIFVGKTDR